MDPNAKPPVNSTPTGPATRSTVDPAPQPDDRRPDAAPDTTQTPATTPAPALIPAAPAQEEADGEEALTDPTTLVQPDTSGDTDTGTSAVEAHPL